MSYVFNLYGFRIMIKPVWFDESDYLNPSEYKNLRPIPIYFTYSQGLGPELPR